jgi:type I restriction-modification system DNA methylase subunit
MNEIEARRLITETFQNQFDEGKFSFFIRNLLNGLDETKTFSYQGQYIPEAYRNHIRQYKRVGQYVDPDGSELDVLIVNLNKEAALERARTMQRNFVAWYLKNRGEKDAAIVAYYSEGLEDWRLSYVRMDYKTEQDQEGKVRVHTDLTPAKRYSFLVGINEPNHTAQQQFVPQMLHTRNSPTLPELEKAFNIESVTKEFFEKYKNLFLKVKDEMDELLLKNKTIKADFASKNISTTDFSKKLLGQIVFLYFIQKKGWLGVGKDKAGSFCKWGSGPKDFLQKLYSGKIIPYDNFFNDLLEPLFYEALATDRGETSYYSRFKCKIPFLNGGLFEPIGGYNWEENDILISNETMGEILTTFDLYNFTVREDEPLEKEVAVDPEMLGKVFENLLEVKDRKSKGAFYTPREIVHYMCQEILINYLSNVLNAESSGYSSFKSKQNVLFSPQDLAKPKSQVELMTPNAPSIPYEDIEIFIRHGAFGIENDQAVRERGRETKSYSYKIPESIRTNANRIDLALSDVKICDPAIGSGAFPVGMLHEIVKARETLTVYIGSHKERTAYDFKRHAIQQSIYGVDIDTGAVEIAKLRLWLSLVVDEEDFCVIKPLPNLDYKIVCGDSLQKVERNVLNDHLFRQMEKLKLQFFDEINPRIKKDEKTQIGRLMGELTNNDEHFDYEIYFSEVFHKKSGFDVVIANPPYVRQEAIRNLKPILKKQFGDFYCGTADLYTYFYKRGLEILKPSGHLCFIAPNKFMRAGYGKNTRKLLAGESTPKVVIDFGELPVFEAGTDPSIILIEKNTPSINAFFTAATIKTAEEIAYVQETVTERGFRMQSSALSSDGWTLEQPEVLDLMKKMRKAGIPLGEFVKGRFYRGVLTGLNEAFVVDTQTRNRLITADINSDELIKPWLRGRDIKKWKSEWAGLYVIDIPSSANKKWLWSDENSEQKARKIFKQTYPAIHDHLSLWEDKLIKREDQGKFWWELRSCAYHQAFGQPKIIYADIAKLLRASYDTTGAFCANTLYILPTTDLSILGFLHSKLFDWYARYNFQALGDALEGGRMRFIAQYMELVPFPMASEKQKAPIVKLVKTILARPESTEIPRLEAEIDHLIYDLYGLTNKEVAIIERKAS